MNGFLIRVADTAQPANNRAFLNDAYGNVLQKVQQGHVLRQLVINGQASGLYGDGVDPAKPSTPDEDGGPAHPNYNPQAQFNLAYRPVTNSYPAAAAGQYPVQGGDTLQSIAQAAYGDSGLWYLIGDANGLSGNEDLRIGATLNIPSRVGGVHNNATTFARYDAARVVGDTTPMLPVPQGRGDGGCGGLGQIIMIVVAVLINVYLPGIGGAIMSAIASQAVGNILGVQDGFDGKAVAMAALSAGVSQGMELAAQGSWVASSSAASTVARSVTER